MRCRPCSASMPFYGKAAVLVVLAALGSLSTGCFEEGQRGPGQAQTEVDLSHLSRPFSFGKVNGAAAARVEVIAAEDLSALSPAGGQFGFAATDDFDGRPPGFSFAGPSSGAREFRYGAEIPDFRSVESYGNPRFKTAAQSSPGLMASAAIYLDRSFNSLFASIFKKANEEASLSAATPGNSREEAGNPFTEARQRADASAASVTRAQSTSSEEAASSKTSESTESSPASQPAPAPAASPAVPKAPPCLFIGDFSGSGQLQAAEADRLDEVTFSFKDSLRIFSLYVNPAAVENQRSFGVEDIDGDGIEDLLVTARASLFGGVLLGHADGTFTLKDSFVTGYEPVVAAAGQIRDGRREILTANMRTGKVATFRASPRYRQVQGQSLLDFRPAFVNHIVELQTGRDFFLAAEAGKAARLFRWSEDSRLEITGESLPMAPSLSLSGEYLSDGAAETIQAYQVGPYASIIVTDSHGGSFNVANFRLTPQLFIAVGDLSHRGVLDVAVANLCGTQAK